MTLHAKRKSPTGRAAGAAALLMALAGRVRGRAAALDLPAVPAARYLRMILPSLASERPRPGNAPSRPPVGLRIRRPFGGRLIRVNFNPASAAILHLLLLGGEQIGWDR